MSVPIYDFLVANEVLASVAMEAHYDCCGKNVCGGEGAFILPFIQEIIRNVHFVIQR